MGAARVAERPSPHHGLCVSPCPLGGFAHEGVREVTRESEAENADTMADVFERDANEGRAERARLASPEGRANAPEHRGQRALDVPRLDPQHLHAVPREVRVSLAVAPLAAHVGGAVDLHDEPRLGSEEVDDGGAEDDLAPEFDAETPPTQRLPQDALRGGGVTPRVLRTGRKEVALVTK